MAEAVGLFTKFVIGIGFGPRETIRSTDVSRLRLAPAFSEAPSTSPSRTVSLYFCLTVPTARLAFRTAFSAAARHRPPTTGIECRSGPRETAASIRPPLTILLPASGSVLITTPGGTVSLYSSVNAMPRPDRPATCSASARLIPASAGAEM